MGPLGYAAALLLGLLALATAGPSAPLASHEQLEGAYDQGIARIPGGWVVSGTDVLARLDEHLETVRRLDAAIPPVWVRRGFDHVGDVDVSGTTVYVPFEQPDYDRGTQAMARYDLRRLSFRDARTVHQHENSFVAVDGASGIAYSMDRFGGRALLRYDIRAGWRRLKPLLLDRTLEKVQGASVAHGAVWLMTDDAQHGVYHVDIGSGAVTQVASAPPADGEGEGIDAAETTAGTLHVTVTDADHVAVTLDHFTTSEDPSPRPSAAAGTTDTSWPPALIYFGIALVVVALAAVGTMFRRARTTLHPKPRPPTSD